MIFDSRLSWREHVETVCKKTINKITVLKHIRRLFDKKQFLKIVTSQVFGLLYYGAPVWLLPTLEQPLWKLINSVHYKALRLVYNDHIGVTPRWKLSSELKRATPREWSKYCTANTVIKVLRNKLPVNLYTQLNETLFFERRRPGIAKFYDSSRLWIGRQTLGCRIDFMNSLPTWYSLGLSDDQIRRLLKSAFFKYMDGQWIYFVLFDSWIF